MYGACSFTTVVVAESSAGSGFGRCAAFWAFVRMIGQGVEPDRGYKMGRTKISFFNCSGRFEPEAAAAACDAQRRAGALLIFRLAAAALLADIRRDIDIGTMGNRA